MLLGVRLKTTLPSTQLMDREIKSCSETGREGNDGAVTTPVYLILLHVVGCQVKNTFPSTQLVGREI